MCCHFLPCGRFMGTDIFPIQKPFCDYEGREGGDPDPESSHLPTGAIRGDGNTPGTRHTQDAEGG